MKFSGHESFVCRYAWLPKAYSAINADPSVFTDVEGAMVKLGVGKNMVRSIRFWVEVLGVATPLPDRTLALTPFGTAVFAKDGFDPFLEDVRTLWLLHWNVATRKADPLFAWDLLLYRWPYPELTRSEALLSLLFESRRLNMNHSEVTLAQHLDIFLHTYIPTRSAKSGIEDILDCPLTELELLHTVGEQRLDGSGRREPVYAFRRDTKPEITTAIFEYCLDDYWRKEHPSEATLIYRNVATAERSIGQVFKLPEEDIRARLDRYTANSTYQPFTYQPSAVQGLIYRHNVGALDFLAAVYTEEVAGV
jgi:hypothetical protein